MTKFAIANPHPHPHTHKNAHLNVPTHAQKHTHPHLIRFLVNIHAELQYCMYPLRKPTAFLSCSLPDSCTDFLAQTYSHFHLSLSLLHSLVRILSAFCSHLSRFSLVFLVNRVTIRLTCANLVIVILEKNIRKTRCLCFSIIAVSLNH